MSDADLAYCVNGDGRLAVGEVTTGSRTMPELADVMGDGGLVEDVDLMCAECLGVVAQ